MPSEEAPPHDNASLRAPDLSVSQQALLREFSQKAGRPALNRAFSVVGRPPNRRIERGDISIQTDISDEELLLLACAGYLEYKSQQHSVAFHGKAYDRQYQIEAMPERHIGTDGFRLGRFSFAFGKYRSLTGVRLLLVLAVIVLTILYITGRMSDSATQTWATIGACLIAALALQIPQRGIR